MLVEAKATIHQRDRRKIEKLLGHTLKITENIHHHYTRELVVCENYAYHMLLHQRIRALEACGHATWRICKYCKEYDSPAHLRIHTYPEKGYKSDDVYHLRCHREHMREYRKNTMQVNILFSAVNNLLLDLQEK